MAEFSEKEIVDWEEEKVIVCKKGQEKFLIKESIQVCWNWSYKTGVVSLCLLSFWHCSFHSGVHKGSFWIWNNNDQGLKLVSGVWQMAVMSMQWIWLCFSATLKDYAKKESKLATLCFCLGFLESITVPIHWFSPPQKLIPCYLWDNNKLR